uniref:Uncharacterized protein n=1 Tax=Rhizophora mucronata TaxID=61149 RepID=A0A2P2KBV2_RHIMU
MMSMHSPLSTLMLTDLLFYTTPRRNIQKDSNFQPQQQSIYYMLD